MVLAYLVHEGPHDLHSNLIYPVVIVPVFGEIPLHIVVHHQTVLVPDGFTFAYLMADRESATTERPAMPVAEVPFYFPVVEGHLELLVAVFVVHVMDDVQGVHIEPCQPFHHVVEFLHHIIVLQVFCVYRAVSGAYLHLHALVHAAVDGVEEAFGQIGPGAEELHLLAHPHGGNAAGDGVIVAVGSPHQIVVLVLDGGKS